MSIPRGGDRKVCKQCKRDLPVGDFYVHKEMGDGHLNFCKVCVKERVNRRYVRRMAEDPAFVDSERERNRARAATPKGRALNKRMRETYPDKTTARVAVGNAVRDGKLIRPDTCPRCGSTEDRVEAHHHDYGKPLDVTWLCSRCHGLAHREVLANVRPASSGGAYQCDKCGAAYGNSGQLTAHARWCSGGRSSYRRQGA